MSHKIIIPNEGFLSVRGPPGTPPSKRIVSIIPDTKEHTYKIQIAPEDVNSLAKKVMIDPRACFVETVTDEDAAGTLGKSPTKNTCFRIVVNKKLLVGGGDENKFPLGEDEIPLKATSQKDRVEWIKCFVDLGAIARGDASISLSRHGASTDDHNNSNTDLSNIASTNNSSSNYDKSNKNITSSYLGSSNRVGGGRYVNPNDTGSAYTSDDGTSSRGDYDECDDYSNTASRNSPSTQHLSAPSSSSAANLNRGGPGSSSAEYQPPQTQPLRPAPPHTLIIPQIKVEDIAADEANASPLSAALSLPQQNQPIILDNTTTVNLSDSFAGILDNTTTATTANGKRRQDSLSPAGTMSKLSQSSIQQQQMQQNTFRNNINGGTSSSSSQQQKDKWPEVTPSSNAIYRCLRSTSNAKLWEQNKSALFSDILPSVEWSVENQPTQKDVTSRAAVEALHQAKSYFNDKRTFTAPYSSGEFDRSLLDDISLSSVDLAYELIGKARHSCDDPRKKPVKCIAALCCLSDVDTERERYANSSRSIDHQRQQQQQFSPGGGFSDSGNATSASTRRPPFLRDAGFGYFEVTENSIAIRQFQGSSTAVRNFSKIDLEFPKSDIISVGPTGVAGCVEQIVAHEYSNWIPHKEHLEFLHGDEPSPLVISLQEENYNHNNKTKKNVTLHLVLLFHWNVRADTAARALSDYWITTKQQGGNNNDSTTSNNNNNNVITTSVSNRPLQPQRGSRLAGGGLSLYALDTDELRVDDVGRKWTMADFHLTLKRRG